MAVTREEWLTEAGKIIMAEVVGPHGIIGDPPVWAVSCGWPSRKALSSSSKRLGECWRPTACADGVTSHIFISPILDELIDGAGDGVLSTLTHELVHVVTPGEGHKGRFRQVAKAIGLEGKMSCAAPGKELSEKLLRMVQPLGPYPHSKLTGVLKKVPERTRMIKAMATKCTECQYVVRTTQVWLTNFGPPKCPHGSLMEVIR